MTDRLLDALIAEKIMGLDTAEFHKYRALVLASRSNPNAFSEDALRLIKMEMHFSHERNIETVLLPMYSSNISAAWSVMEKIVEENWRHSPWLSYDRDYQVLGCWI